MRVTNEQREIIIAYLCSTGTSSKDADDIAQETLIRAWRYDKGQVQSISAWLIGVAKNVRIDMWRAKLRDRKKVLKPSHLPTPFASMVGQQLQQKLLAYPLLQELVDGASYQELAEKYACPINTIKVRVHRARKKLEAEYADIEA